MLEGIGKAGGGASRVISEVAMVSMPSVWWCWFFFFNAFYKDFKMLFV